MRPDGVHVARGPAAEPFRVVEIPVAEIVDGTNQIVPVVAGSELGDPRLAASEPVAFQAGADGNPACGLGPGALDPAEIFGKFRLGHPPIIERFGDLRSVIGNPVFAESSFHRSLDEGFRFALGMAAKRRVGVIVGGHLRISG